MLKLRKRHDLWHLDIHYRDPETGKRRRFRRSTGLESTRQNRREATELGNRTLRELETRGGTAARVESSTVADFAWRWFQEHCQVWLKPSTQRAYWQILRVHVVPALGDQKLYLVGRRDIDRYVGIKKAQLAHKTVNNHLGVLSCMFRKAVEWEELASSPCAGVRPLPLEDLEPVFWSFAEAEAFLAVAADAETDWHLLFLTALRTGLRQGELFALRWKDIDFKRGVVHVRRSYSHGCETTPKSNRSRRVPMTDGLRNALTKRSGRLEDLVFSAPNGDYLTNSRARRALNRIARAADVPRIRFHDLRHTFASHLVIKEKSLNAVRELLGHSNMKMTLRYAHLAPDALRATVQCLDEPSRHASRHATASGPELKLVKS
jgi:integrase